MASDDNFSFPSRNDLQTNQSPNKKKRIIKIIYFVILFLFLCGIAYLGYIYLIYEKTIDNISSGSNEVVAKEELADNKPRTILLLGLDSRKETGTMNTDVIMVASFNPQTKSSTIVSIPRDTYVKVEGYLPRKANAFYSVVTRLEKDSADKADKVVAKTEIRKIFGEFLGIHIDYVSVINFDAFKEIVDQLGGIDVDVDMDMRYTDPTDGTDINLKKGMQKLDGENALDFVRYRMSNGDTASSSDFERNQRQQKVIAAMIDEVKSFNIILKVVGILNALGDNIETDIPNEQLRSFIKTYAGISNSNIDYSPIQGTWTYPYIYLEESEIQAAQDSLLKQFK